MVDVAILHDRCVVCDRVTSCGAVVNVSFDNKGAIAPNSGFREYPAVEFGVVVSWNSDVVPYQL